jgi:hypothetical protein
VHLAGVARTVLGWRRAFEIALRPELRGNALSRCMVWILLNSS